MKKKQRVLTFIFLLIILITVDLRAPITSVGPLMPEITRELGSSTLSGFLTSVVLFVFAFGSLLVLRMQYHKTIFVGLICMFVGLVLRSFGYDIFSAPSFAFYLFLGTFLIGVGVAIGNVFMPVLIKKYFAHKMGLLTGIYAAMLSISSLLGAGLSLPISEKFGFKSSLAIWSLMALVVLFAWLPMIRGTRWKSKFFLPKKDFDARLFRNMDVWVITFFMGVQSLIFYSVTTWYPSILHEKGFGMSESSYLNSFVQLASVFSALFIPRWCAHMSRKRRKYMLLLLSHSYAFAFILLLIPFHSVGVGVLASSLLALPIGGTFGVALLYISMSAKDVNTSLFISSFAQFGGYLISTLGPLVVGFLRDKEMNFTSSLVFLVVSSVVLIFLGLRLAYVKKI